MARSKSSARWLKEHFDDPFVKQAQKEGYRSRAAYKLLEIQKKYKIFHSNQIVVDLGAAPGSWTQVVHTLIGNKGRIIALDLLPMDSVPGTTIITGDFSSDEVYQKLTTCLQDQEVDVVLSDIAPNMSGIKSVDQAKSMYLLELALDFALKTLKKHGSFVAKGFQGAGFDTFAKGLRDYFVSVHFVKPEASRGRSAELYLVAKGRK